MILGFSTSSFTLIHVLVSLAAIGSGFVVLFGFLKGNRIKRWTMIFVMSTLISGVTGFLFPFDHLLPSHILGLLSVTALTIASLAYNAFGFTGASGMVYVASLVASLYFDCFAAVMQLFAKIPPLRDVAPTRTEWPYVSAQSVILALFTVLIYKAAKRFSAVKLGTM